MIEKVLSLPKDGHNWELVSLYEGLRNWLCGFDTITSVLLTETFADFAKRTTKNGEGGNKLNSVEAWTIIIYTISDMFNVHTYQTNINHGAKLYHILEFSSFKF